MDRMKQQLRVVIFGSDTRAGKTFDLLLIGLILFSVALVFLESVTEVRERYGAWLKAAEWTVTVLFSIEYIVRLWISEPPKRYAMSFFGIVDLLAILPTYLSVLVPGAQALGVVRAMRLMRVFRILNLVSYVREARLLLLALLASRHRIIVFMLAVLALVTLFGAIMYVVESPEAGFTSVPRSIYWAIVTLTTVGYGDIAPVTPLGQAIASVIMILGYAIIAIPTGIVSVELSRQGTRSSQRACTACGKLFDLADARYCPHCGKPMGPVSAAG
ncbi:MAG: ion transporter [Flavobacteriales bacterium]|jgi:voltage-gated potassium channel|nr:ion transporter [Flavobacteriales bacterium]